MFFSDIAFFKLAAVLSKPTKLAYMQACILESKMANKTSMKMDISLPIFKKVKALTSC